MLLGFLCFILGWYAFYFIQRFTDTQVCAVAKAEDLSYDVMLSDNTDCEDVMVEENGVRVLCNTKDMTGNVTIHVCGGSFCKSLTTPLSESLTHTHTHTHTHIHLTHTHLLTHSLSPTYSHNNYSLSAGVSCNRATWGFCKERNRNNTISGVYEIRFRANFATYDGDWEIEVVSSSEEDGEILVRDTFGGVSVGQPRIALYDAAFDCDPDGMYCCIIDLHLATYMLTQPAHTCTQTHEHVDNHPHATHIHMFTHNHALICTQSQCKMQQVQLILISQRWPQMMMMMIVCRTSLGLWLVLSSQQWQ